MSEPSARKASSAKNGTVETVGDYRRGRRLNADVMRISRGCFPVKTAHHLADITGYSVRACERWLSERVVMADKHEVRGVLQALRVAAAALVNKHKRIADERDINQQWNGLH